MSRVAAIVLAAGLSSRMAGRNKLLADLNGTPVLTWTLRAIATSRADPVMVVTGYDAAQVEELIQGFDATAVHNSEFASGMAGSIRAGVASLAGEVEGVLICLGDMPGVSTEAIDRLIAASGPGVICVPESGGNRGQPVLFGRDFLPELAGITGDNGARQVLWANSGSIVGVEMPDEGVLLDADTPEALEVLRGFLR